MVEYMKSEVRHPLEGLPVLDGLKCTRCPDSSDGEHDRHRLTISTKTFATHVREAHQGSGSEAKLVDMHAERVPLQTVSRVAPRLEYFQVGYLDVLARTLLLTFVL